jgi:DNA-binding SARP family transcriptional activator
MGHRPYALTVLTGRIQIVSNVKISVSRQTMAALTLRLLGAPQALYRGQPLKFRSRKVLALLIYLVVEGGQHERDKLTDLFWPESDQQRGRTALRNTLARLRQSLAGVGEFIITEGNRVGFDFEQLFDLDVRAVDAVVSALSPETPFDTLQTALDQVQGEFLDGFSLPDAPDFETWATGQREWWHRRGEALFAEVARRQLAQGKFTEAIETATNWTRYAPLNETAYQSLIEAYALAGDRTVALQAYETCQSILADELGVSPSTETMALAKRVRQDTIARAQHPGVTARTAAGEAAQAGTSTPGPLVIPLVGRAAGYSRLVAIYRQAVQGKFQTVALIGEAGMGKTRLAETFLDWASLDATPADVLQGRAFEIGGNLPYQPVVDALRHRLDRENAPDDLLDDVWLAELSQLLPELRSRYPDLPLPMAGNADFVQARLFKAVTHLGLALAERQPVALFIADVQWADAGNDLVYVYEAEGDIRRTVALAETATALWRELGNQPMLTDSLVVLANVQAMCGFYDTALTIAAEPLQISQSLENKWAISYSLFAYALVYSSTMTVAPALAAMNESIQLAQEVGFTGAQVIMRLWQAQLLLALGDVAQARTLAETAANIAVSTIPLFLSTAQGVLALVALQEGKLAEAEHILTSNSFKDLSFSLMNFLTPELAVCCYALKVGNYEAAYTFSDKVLALLLEQNLRMYISDFYYFQGRALLGLNRIDEAREVLAKALTLLRDTGGRWHFWEIAGLLADLEEQAGNEEVAVALRHEARTTLEFIIDHIPEGELRASFVALPGAEVNAHRIKVSRTALSEVTQKPI